MGQVPNGYLSTISSCGCGETNQQAIIEVYWRLYMSLIPNKFLFENQKFGLFCDPMIPPLISKF